MGPEGSEPALSPPVFLPNKASEAVTLEGG